MEIIQGALKILASVISLILKPLNLSENFTSSLDGAFTFIITVIEGASWLIPLDILVVCLGVVFVVDNYGLIVKIVKWIVSLIRG